MYIIMTCALVFQKHIFLKYRLRVSDINHMMTKHIFYTLLTQHIINGMVERNILMISSLPLIECVRVEFEFYHLSETINIRNKIQVNKSIMYTVRRSSSFSSSAASSVKNVTKDIYEYLSHKPKRPFSYNEVRIKRSTCL